MANFHVAGVSCVGAGNKNSVEDCVAFLCKNKKAELGVGISHRGAGKLVWLTKLLYLSKKAECMERVCTHVNLDWIKQIADADIPLEIELLLKFYNGIKLQLNLEGSCLSPKDFDPAKYASVLTYLASAYGARFVLPYGSKLGEKFVKDVMSHVTVNRANFSVLCDRSFGHGKMASKYEPAILTDVLQGYAGGLCAENIEEELNKIKDAQVPWENVKIYVDAERKLSSSENSLDLNKAQKFYDAVLSWVKTDKKKLNSPEVCPVQ